MILTIPLYSSAAGSQGDHSVIGMVTDTRRLVAYDGGSVTLAGQVVGHQDVAGAESPFGAVADADFHLAGQGDDVLPARRGVPVGKIAGFKASEIDAGGYLHTAVDGPLGRQVQVFKWVWPSFPV